MVQSSEILPPHAKTGRPPLDRRQVLNALLDLYRTGVRGEPALG